MALVLFGIFYYMIIKAKKKYMKYIYVYIYVYMVQEQFF